MKMDIWLCGWEDTYDYTQQVSGVGTYDIMSYNYYPHNPAPPNPYFRNIRAGWGNPTVLNGTAPNTQISIPYNQVSAYMYERRDGINNKEYYMFEAVDPIGSRWQDFWGPGLYIWHIDGKKTNNDEGQMTASKHYQVSLEQADGQFHLENNINAASGYGDYYDAFYKGSSTFQRPAGTGEQFTDTSTPNSKWWDGTNSLLKITQISAIQNPMTFIWDSAPTYTVTYNMNGGTGTAPTETPKIQGATFVVASASGITPPPGKQFKHWNTNASGTGTTYTVGSTGTMGTANIILYAIWEDAPTYTVTYNLSSNSGTGTGTTPTETSKVAGATFSAKSGITGITAPAGKQFKYWYTTPTGTGGTAYGVGATVVMPANNLTLYAIWENLYTVTYNLSSNSGTGTGTTPTETSKVAGAIFSAKSGTTGITAPSEMKFKHWYTTPTGTGGTAYGAGTTMVMPSSNLTLYAIWEYITYPITYNLTSSSGSGGGTLPTEAPRAAGTTFTAALTTGLVPPTGKQFKEWNTNSAGTGTAYEAGAIVTVPSGGLTLYAVWREKLYTVTYSLSSSNGTGTGTVPTESDKDAGQTFIIALTTGIEAPSGKQFKEWNTRVDGMGTSYEPGETAIMTAVNVTLYAIWENIQMYSVTYNLSSHGGIGTGVVPTETPKVEGTTFTIASISGIIPPTGQQFKEWNTNFAGTGTSYAPGVTMQMPKYNVILYAIWENIPAGKYTITYSLSSNSGTGTGITPTETPKGIGELFMVAGIEGIIAPEGKKFKEWNTNVNGTGSVRAPGTSVMVMGDVKLYAIWENAQTYTVTYNLNGGTGTTPTETSKAEGTTFKAKSGTTGIEAPIGKQFKHWYTTQTGTGGTAYLEGATVTMSAGNLILYAIWENKTYTVTYDLNFGTGTVPVETNKAYNTTFAAALTTGMEAPIGKQFKHWYTTSTGMGGTAYGAGTTVTMPAGNLKLYAIWENINYTVTYDLNLGTGTTPTETNKTYNATFTAALTTGIEAPIGKQFKYWYTTSTGTGGTAYEVGTTVIMPANNLTLYAIWENTPSNLGDVNQDGVVNIVDIVRLANYVAGKISLTSEELLNADVNKDGLVNIVDIVRLANYIAGKISTL